MNLTTNASSTSSGASTIAWSHVTTPGLLAGFVMTVIVLVATLIVGLANLRNVHATSDAVTQTYSVKVALQQLLSTILDAEAGGRGFIITGAPGYLRPYDQAVGTISDEFMQVRQLMANDPAQHADLERLSDAVNQKLQELDQAIRHRRDSGFAAAQSQVSPDVSRRNMNEIRAVIARMEAREDALHGVRTVQEGQSYRIARLTELIATGVALLAVAALFAGTLRYGAMRLRATRAAEAQQAALREALQQKDDFVALVSHELRTPTNTIVGWARMLAQRTMKPEKFGHAVAAIERGADSLRQLIDDLMDTSQLASGRMRLTVTDLDFREVVRDAIEAVRLSAENKGVMLTDAIQPELPSIRGDAGRLKQVVWNLLANAIKFTPTGGHVTAALISTEFDLRLEVHDTGVGIDPAFLPHVFERYRQAPASMQLPRSLGLGLAIVRHLVELHGGTVTAHSPGLGRGSTFVVELPLAPVPQAATAKSPVERA